MTKLDKVVESVLRESIGDDAAELVGIEPEEAAERIAGLSFANYLELGNAVDIEDVETAREILGTVSQIEESKMPIVKDTEAGRCMGCQRRNGQRHKDNCNMASLDEDSYNEEKLLDKPTPTLKDLAKKHDMSLGDIGAQLAKGIKAEKEHTSDMLVAKEIALDHLNELPDYYTKLEKMEESGIKGKAPNKSKNYKRTGGNKQQYKWKITFNNGKSKTVWADSRYNATHGQISPEQHIIGIKSAKKINEADNPYAAPKAAPASPAAAAPSAGSSIDALAQPNATSNDIDNENNQRKEVDDLSIGDDIEVIDISGDPTAVTVKNPRGPGETLIVQTNKGEEHMIKKMAVSGTPKLQEGRVKEFYWGEAERMTREEFVAKYGEDLGEFWDNIHGIEDPLDHLREMYNARMSGTTKFSEFIGEGLSEEDALALDAAIIKEANLEEGEVSDPVQAGDSIVVRRESTLTGQTKDFEGTVIDYDPNYYDGKVGVAFNDGKEDLRAWYPVNGRLSGRMYDEYVIMPSVDEARQGGKTEHSGAKKGRGGYYGRKKDAKADSNKNRRKADKQAVNEGGDFYFYIEPHSEGNGADVMNSNGEVHDHYDSPERARLVAAELNAKYSKVDEAIDDNACPICMGSGDATEPDYIDPSNPDQCSYCNGTGSLKGKFDEAKWDYRKRDKGKGAGTDSPMYDGGAKNRKSRKAFRKAEKAKAHQARMRGEVDESVLSDHVKVEYTDPKGRYIIVTAGVAGYWAVGQDRYYDSFDRTSFKNLDDALRDAEETAMNLDEGISRIMELAGIIEEGTFGVYRKSKAQMDSDDGHTAARSAMVKRGGSHVTFKNKRQADKWIADNSKGENMFARKVSKSVKEASTTMYNRKEEWMAEAERRGYEVERGGDNKIYAHLDGIEYGYWDPNYGGFGTGVFFKLNETASGGATGAGAIASAPAAMNGMQSRNQSIYGKTNKKPKPKERAKESTEDGIGRIKK